MKRNAAMMAQKNRFPHLCRNVLLTRAEIILRAGIKAPSAWVELQVSIMARTGQAKSFLWGPLTVLLDGVARGVAQCDGLASRLLYALSAAAVEGPYSCEMPHRLLPFLHNARLLVAVRTSLICRKCHGF